VDEARRCVSIAHLGRDLTLIRDEQRAGKGRVVAEGPIYGTSRARSDSRQEVGRLARSAFRGER
jgi:hypothetical protein